MWSDPRVIRVCAGLVWDSLRENWAYASPMPDSITVHEAPPTLRPRGDQDVVNRAYQIYGALANEVGPDSDPDNLTPSYERVFRDEVVGLVKMIERENYYSLVSAFKHFASDLQFYDNLVEQSAIMSQVTAMIQILLGDPYRALVGTRYSKPAWKKLSQPASPRRLVELAHYYSLPLEYIAQSDVDLIPQPEYCHNASVLQDKRWSGRASSLRNKDLMEAAYYNQRYTVDSEGACVKIAGLPGVSSVTLKARRSIWDTNAHDLLARIELDSGSYIHLYDALRSTSLIDASQREYEDRGSIDFFDWLAVQIYHDLVTTVDIPISTAIWRGNGDETEAGGPTRPPESEGSSWIYIPRSSRSGQSVLPRTPLANPRISTPHRVRGHKRRANMTEVHRQAILAFEAETEISVLEWLPSGYTFVRPHISPAVGNEELTKLPRFIRVRIQEELKRLLQDTSNSPP